MTLCSARPHTHTSACIAIAVEGIEIVQRSFRIFRVFLHIHLNLFTSSPALTHSLVSWWSARVCRMMDGTKAQKSFLFQWMVQCVFFFEVSEKIWDKVFWWCSWIMSHFSFIDIKIERKTFLFLLSSTERKRESDEKCWNANNWRTNKYLRDFYPSIFSCMKMLIFHSFLLHFEF